MQTMQTANVYKKLNGSSLSANCLDYCIYCKIRAYAYFPKEVCHRRLFFNGCLILNSQTLKRAYLRPYLAHKNGSPIKIYSILPGIWIGAYFPRQGKCKANGRLFSKGAYFWVGAYFPVNTVFVNWNYLT